MFIACEHCVRIWVSVLLHVEVVRVQVEDMAPTQIYLNIERLPPQPHDPSDKQYTYPDW